MGIYKGTNLEKRDTYEGPKWDFSLKNSHPINLVVLDKNKN